MTYPEMLTYWEEIGYEPVQQVVVCAACINQDSGLIICGARHWDSVMSKVLKTLRAEGSTLRSYDFEQGFIDQWGTFLTRKEAMVIAKAAGQDIDIERGCGGSTTTLYSEGLY